MRVGRVTYARARLLLGIAGVGAQVVLAVVAVALDLPGRFLPDGAGDPLAGALPWVAAALLVPTVLQLPLDVIGGTVAVRRRPAVGAWLVAWARGVGVQLAVWLASAALLMLGARAAGAAGACAAGVALQVALLLGRGPLARRAARIDGGADDATRVIRRAAETAGLAADDVQVVAPHDESFVGGWTGWRGHSLWVPATWATLPTPAIVGQLARRRVARGSLHARGVSLGLAWNVAGLALMLWGAGVDARSAAGVVTLVALLVPWSFVGLLVLPTPSRWGVHAVDRAAARAVGADAVRAALAPLDRWQDDEPTRGRALETIFHPVPALTRRLARLDALDARDPMLAAPHAARHALFLAWGLCSPLSRAPHCNVGRPALWVFWPGD